MNDKYIEILLRLLIILYGVALFAMLLIYIIGFIYLF